MDAAQKSDKYLQSLEALEKQLAATYQRKAELERDIQTLDLPTGIQNLPVELLSPIFEIVVAEDIRYLRDILLVCSSWDQVVLNTPRLWSTIHLIIPPTIAGVKNSIEFATRCIERSGQNPLDVIIDHRAFPTKLQLLEAAITPNIDNTIDFPIFAIEWIFKNASDDFQYQLSSWYPNVWATHLEPFATLLGDDGALKAMMTTRCRSFEFHMHPEICETRELLKRVFPNGLRIPTTVESFKLRSNSPWYQPPTWVVPLLHDVHQNVQPGGRTQDQSVLRVFVLENLILKEEYETFYPLSIHHLSLVLYKPQQLLSISRLRNLERLAIGVFYIYREFQTFQLKPVTFPHLTHLHIQSNIPVKFFQFFNTPSLQTLIIGPWCWEDFIPPSMTFKNLFPSLTRLELPRLMSSEKTTYTLRRSLLFVLTNAPLLNTLLLNKQELRYFHKVVPLLKEAGVQLGGLRRFLLTEDRDYTKIVEDFEASSLSNFL